MTLEQTACEDLKAFERRLTEIVQFLQPPTTQWRALLAFVVLCVVSGANMWLFDPETSRVSLSASLHSHWFFSLSVITLMALFACGVHRRVVMPAIIIQRARNVLEEFNMNCDDTGRLILKPRPQQ
ncbi:nuclear envelope phosphatase-regulatory subunit 1-like [Varroa jacobsoni]|uniref:Transmembrane protein 188 n=1 Tax=Varroa destructor TaxID=109461 RepID=A0A7M7J597_VARDE|nr:nuclear envelope phosphatase-regulatory subunit 1-like [Varroa destructor]XP_022692284.1 nuclear envelope phosphatase-regulatory subunit 1-like [Varroa jacobsoni]